MFYAVNQDDDETSGGTTPSPAVLQHHLGEISPLELAEARGPQAPHPALCETQESVPGPQNGLHKVSQEHMRACMYKHKYICICVYILYMHTGMYVRMHLGMYVRTDVCMYACVCVSICIQV